MGEFRMITEASIRERLAQDRAKVSRLASWEEIEFLLAEIDSLRSERSKALELLAFEPTTSDLLYAIEKRARQSREDRAAIDGVRTRVSSLVLGEKAALHAQMTRTERSCRKATRNAYQMVLDLLDEPHES